MTEILGAIGDVTTLMGDLFDVMTGNAYFLFLLAAGLVGVGIAIFRKIRSAAK